MKLRHVCVIVCALACLANCTPAGRVRIIPPPPTSTKTLGSPALDVRSGTHEPFNAYDITEYLISHPTFPHIRLPDDVVVSKLEFITAAEVTRRLNGESPGVAAAAKIGFATLNGTFVFTGPRGSLPAHFTHAYLAFDAVTGNLLMMGSLP